MNVCRRAKCMASAKVSAPPSRCCAFQPESMPMKIWIDPTVCVIIRIGAISIEKIVS